MTDITALMATMKAAAEKATPGPWHLSNENKLIIRDEDGIWIASTGYFDNPIEISDGEFIAEANPVNVLALVEALEKAQGMEDYWKTQCRGIADHSEKLQAQIEQWEKLNAQFCSNADADISALRQRIAELESRTVTVKLPDSFYPDGDIELPLVMNEYQVFEALVAAGCKPVAVCPRCKRELDLSVKHDGAHYCHSAAGIQVIEREGQ